MLVQPAQMLYPAAADSANHPYKEFMPGCKALQPEIFFIEPDLIHSRNAAGKTVELRQVLDPTTQGKPIRENDAVRIDAIESEPAISAPFHEQIFRRQVLVMDFL